MSIKTDELQQLPSVQPTDSLLLDSIAAGTARLTMAQAAAFFGAELAKPGNPVGAALSSVELASVPSRTVKLAAGELQGYINSLPRLVAENLTLSVTGELDTKVELRDFYGPGIISVSGANSFTLRNSLAVSGCRLHVVLSRIGFQEREGMTANDGLVLAEHCTAVTYVSNCRFTGLGGEGKASGVLAEFGSRVMLANAQAAGLCNAVSAFTCSSVAVYGEESAYQDNATGAWSRLGGIVALSGGMPETLGGIANVKNGGLVVKADGTLL